MSNNVNLITVCSLVIGNNVPLHFNKQEQQAEMPKAPAPPVDEVPSEGSKVAKNEEKAVSTPCVYRGLVRRVAIVGVLALVLSLRCRKRP